MSREQAGGALGLSPLAPQGSHRVAGRSPSEPGVRGRGGGQASPVEYLEVGDQVVVVVSMRSGQRCILRCEAANTAAGTSTILAK